MLTLLLVAIFFACFGFLFTEGMWSNTVRLVNVVTAALLATNSFEWVAQELEGWWPSFSYYWDFLAMWGLFVLFTAIFRGATDFISKVKVRFRKITDQVGSPILALLIAWVMVCFTAASLHTAPLPRNFMGYKPGGDAKMFLGLAPDLKWLAFVQSMSRGTFSSRATPEDIQKEPDWQKDQKCTFDPRSEFLLKYATRRADLEKHVKKTGTTRVVAQESTAAQDSPEP
jgi:hypothetical protein